MRQRPLTIGNHLYHYTNIGSLIGILSTGYIEKYDSDLSNLEDFSYKTFANKTQLPFVSLTRNKNLHLIDKTYFEEMNFCIRMTIDREVVSRRNRTTPFNYFASRYAEVKTNANQYESEERVFGNIPISAIKRIDYSPLMITKTCSLNDVVYEKCMLRFLDITDMIGRHKNPNILFHKVVEKIQSVYGIETDVF